MKKRPILKSHITELTVILSATLSVPEQVKFTRQKNGYAFDPDFPNDFICIREHDIKMQALLINALKDCLNYGVKHFYRFFNVRGKNWIIEVIDILTIYSYFKYTKTRSIIVEERSIVLFKKWYVFVFYGVMDRGKNNFKHLKTKLI